MGTVYRANDIELEETVALKVLKPELGSPAFIERFRREVKLARRVTHPNVARMYDIGDHDGTRFLTMEFIDGHSLTEILRRNVRMPVPRVLDIATHVCAGLSAAHRAGVVHRDLKPDNVMIARDGRVVITDFGIAREPLGDAGKHTLGGIVGTPAYMAPEQIEARPDIDGRADIYALGVMLFELLTGELPWKGDSALALAAARLYTDAPNPCSLRSDLPALVGEVVLRCMAREPEQRFVDPSDVAQALARATPTLAQGSQSPTPTLPPRSTMDTGRADKTVAVLPFRNLGAPEDDYVADALTDELIDTLSMTPGLRVRPRGAILRYKGVDADPRQIGRELQVEVVVEGSVRRAGEQVRLTARLTSVEDGFQLWAKRFDRPANDLLVVSDETARAIAEALTVRAAQGVYVAPTDAVAIDLYLRARAEAHQLGADRLMKAIELYHAAHERAPHDVKILSGYARACARAWFFQGTAPTDTAERARSLARRATEVAPDDPEALLALAMVHLMDHDGRSAAECCRRALSRAPSHGEALALCGRLLLEAGRPELAIERLEAALQVDSTLRPARLELIRAHALLGNVDRAVELLDAAIGMPDYQGDAVARARMALWSPEFLESLSNVSVPENASPSSPWRLVMLAQSVARGEQQDEAIVELSTLANRARGASRFATLLYQILTELTTHLGRLDDAFGWLSRAVDSGLVDIAWLNRCNALAPMRQDGRFSEARIAVAERAAGVLEALGVE